MTYVEMLGRRSEMLKRDIGNMIMMHNKRGLNVQESYFFRNMVKQLHQNEHELHANRK
ncbi:hypothetical protein ACFOHW_06710 [Paenibacillus abyssi]|uniref:Uncharacterized protein n=1 Tax=Paenibacillus abyssi TaxID=1340531 RepID=A0A917FW51_9BACL|nr:hypothetical protein GCM10010916_24100 [Paenibacillus abyssi]